MVKRREDYVGKSSGDLQRVQPEEIQQMSELKYYKSPKADKRPKLSAAISKVVERYNDGKDRTSIFIPPRVGKSTVIRGSAAELVHNNGAMTCLMMAPWSNLTKQIVSSEDVREEARRYQIGENGNPSLRFRTHQVKRLRDHTFFRNSEGPYTLCSMTMGLAIHNKTILKDAIEMASASDFRVPVFADESQLMKLGKAYGALLNELISVGAYVVVLTGTPWTSDNSELFGFNWEPTKKVSRKGAKLSDHREDDDGRRFAWRTPAEYKSTVGKWRADYEITYREAFQDMGALNGINLLEVTCEVEPVGGGKPKQLRDINFDSSDYSLKSVIQSPEITRQSVTMLLRRLVDWHRTGLKATALVVTGSDSANESNWHAREIKREIERQAPTIPGAETFTTEIATSVLEDGNPDEKAQAKIIEFREHRGADILIVKMMGLVGLDAGHLKVEAYLSPLRNGPMAAQGVTRVCTKWSQSDRLSDLIIPADQKMTGLCHGLLEEAIVETTRVEEVIEGCGEEIELKETDPVEVTIGNAEIDSADITGEHVKDVGDLLEKLALVRFSFPELNPVSDPHVLRMIQSDRINIPTGAAEKMAAATSKTVQDGKFVYVNEDDDIEDARQSYNEAVKSAAGDLMGQCKKGIVYGQVIGKLWKESKRLAGIHAANLSDCNDLAKIKKGEAMVPSAKMIVLQKYGK